MKFAYPDRAEPLHDAKKTSAAAMASHLDSYSRCECVDRAGTYKALSPTHKNNLKYVRLFVSNYLIECDIISGDALIIDTRDKIVVGAGCIRSNYFYLCFYFVCLRIVMSSVELVLTAA